MKPGTGREIAIVIRVMGAVHSPEPRNAMEEIVLAVACQVQHQQRRNQGQPRRSRDAIEQSPAVLIAQDRPTDADEREQRIFLVYSLLAAWYIASILLLVAGTVYGWLDKALGLAGGVLFALAWVSGFDIIYATLDLEFDRAHGLHSMPAWLGRKRALLVAAVLHVIAFAQLVALAIAGWGARQLFPPGLPWALPVMATLLAVAGVLLLLEQRWAEDVNLAFFKVNVWVGFAVLAVVLFSRYVRGDFFPAVTAAVRPLVVPRF